MKTAFLCTLAGCALALGLASGHANGQQGPRTPVGQDQAAPAGVKLTNESLLSMIQNLGYTPKVQESGNSKFHNVTIPQDGVEYDLSIQISPNNEKIWLIVRLADLPKDSIIAAERLLKLLELNDQIGPNFFRYNKASGGLFLARAFDNRAVTPAILRDNMVRLLTTCSQTKDAWIHNNWATPVTAQAK